MPSRLLIQTASTRKLVCRMREALKQLSRPRLCLSCVGVREHISVFLLSETRVGCKRPGQHILANLRGVRDLNLDASSASGARGNLDSTGYRPGALLHADKTEVTGLGEVG